MGIRQAIVYYENGRLRGSCNEGNVSMYAFLDKGKCRVRGTDIIFYKSTHEIGR